MATYTLYLYTLRPHPVEHKSLDTKQARKEILILEYSNQGISVYRAKVCCPFPSKPALHLLRVFIAHSQTTLGIVHCSLSDYSCHNAAL